MSNVVQEFDSVEVVCTITSHSFALGNVSHMVLGLGIVGELVRTRDIL